MVRAFVVVACLAAGIGFLMKKDGVESIKAWLNEPMAPAAPDGSDIANCLINIHKNGQKEHTQVRCSSQAERNQKRLKKVVKEFGKYGKKYEVHLPNGQLIDDYPSWATRQQGETTVYVVPATEWWMWDPVEVGHTQTLPELSPRTGKPLVLETVAVEPRLFRIQDYLSDAEVTALIEAAEPNLERSMVSQYGGTKQLNQLSDVRNSNQAWLNGTEAISISISNRVASLTQVPADLGERMQVVRYLPGQHYHAHYDYFDPALFPDRKDLLDGRNRLFTVLLYLNDVEEGGQTVFPRAGPTGFGRNAVSDFAQCTQGVVVPPKKYQVVLFYNLLDGSKVKAYPDIMSLHGGCDVVTGLKWVSNKWVYNRAPVDTTAGRFAAVRRMIDEDRGDPR